ncbi:hypothetical protein [Clostridium aceticum]|uniref:hypothetical protein n=1 Tax=Clostridium aceticum TaxID=84022 RepID=UPI000B1CA92F|nr:hypothetical protein [Clostridium aceticum]
MSIGEHTSPHNLLNRLENHLFLFVLKIYFIFPVIIVADEEYLLNIIMNLFIEVV